MFARNVSMHLKPNSVVEFTRTLDQEIIPLLRKQKGVQDEIAFVAPNGQEAIGIRLWYKKEEAETYSRTTYQQGQKALVKGGEGTPQVHTYVVSNSSFHMIASRLCA